MLNISKNHILILFLVSAVMLTANLSVIPINIMEARNYITAREMVQDNHWFLTTMNGDPRYEKPPLPTWITAFFGFLSGFESLYVLRLAVVLITLLLVYYTYKLSLKIGLSESHSFRNGLILITSFYIYFAGRDNQWDIYCHSFTMVSIYYLWKILQKETYPVKNAVLGGVFLGFSILSKGPVSLYALFLPFLIAYGWVYKFQFKKSKQFNLSLLLYAVIGLVIGVSWSTYVHWADPEPLVKMAEVETSRWVNDYNSKSLFYYWQFFIQSGIWAVASMVALFYPYMKTRVSNVKAYRFTLIWSLGSLVLLSVIPEKKVRYILPMLIPLAINTGFYVEYFFNSLCSKKDKLLAYISFGLPGIVGIVYPFVLFFIFYDKVSNQPGWAVISSALLFIIGLLVFFKLYKDKLKQAFYLLILLQCVVMVFIFPLAKSFLYNSHYKSASELAVLQKKEDLKGVYFFKYMTPEIVWDYGHKIPVIEENEVKDLVLKSAQQKVGILCPPDLVVLLKESAGEECKVQESSHVDLNTVSPDDDEYNSRLIRTFLVISRK